MADRRELRRKTPNGASDCLGARVDLGPRALVAFDPLGRSDFVWHRFWVCVDSFGYEGVVFGYFGGGCSQVGQ